MATGAITSTRSVLTLLLLVVATVAACSGTGGDGDGSPTTAGTAGPGSAAPSTIAVTRPQLPAIQTLAKAGGVAIKATNQADWTLVAHGRAWVAGLGKGVGVYDARTGRPLGSVAVPQLPCAAMDEGFGAVWTATCGSAGISRIDPAKGRVTGRLELPVPSDGESSIGAGEGAVWAITDRSACTSCAVARIDPKSMRVTNKYLVPEGATAIRAGLGGVWITYFETDRVVRLDPATGKTVATIPVASGPRFFDVGAGGVWVMAQRAGALCQIDPEGDRLVGCSVIDPNGVQGGDLTVGSGFVWFRGSDELVAQIDPKTGRAVRRIGPSKGSGSASAGSGQLWISAHDVATVYRVPVG
jgi:streptogramin lyase